MLLPPFRDVLFREGNRCGHFFDGNEVGPRTDDNVGASFDPEPRVSVLVHLPTPAFYFRADRLEQS